LLATLAPALGACSNGRDDARPTTTTSSQPKPDTSPSTSLQGSQPPPLNTAGEDLNAVIRSIFEYRTWISRHPDPEAFKAIYSQECTCLANDQAKYADYVAKGQRWDDGGIVVLKVTEIRRVNENFVRMRVVTEHGPQRLVDAAGKVIREGPGWKPFADVYELVRPAPGAPWKVSLIDNVGYLEGQGRP
jgi:hypothetical protein